MNHIHTRNHSRAARCALLTAVWLALPAPSPASETVDASAVARYEYNSNVFDLQGAHPVPGTTDFQHSYSLYTYCAALDANYLWSQQKLFAAMTINEFRYDHFTR